jgi:hypothetical protein
VSVRRVVRKSTSKDVRSIGVNEVEEFFKRLEFKVNQRGEVLASKVFERYDGNSIARVWIEVYRGEAHYSLVFGLTTRSVEDLKYLVEALNNVLEDYTRARGFKRVV